VVMQQVVQWAVCYRLDLRDADQVLRNLVASP
jgi:hypothetical protein